MPQLMYGYYGLKETLSLKIDFWGFLCMTSLVYGMRVLFFENFFRFDTTLGGWTVGQIHGLFTCSLFLILLVNAFGVSIHTFFQHVYEGRIEALLCQPVSTPRLLLLRWWHGGHLITAVLLGIIAGAVGWETVRSWCTTGRLVGAGALLLVSGGMNLAFLLLLESFTYIARRRLPVDFIYSELARLTQLPPTLLGGEHGIAVLVAAPVLFSSSAVMHFVYFGPSRLTGWFLLGSALLILTAVGTFLRLRRRFDGHGG